MTDIDEQQLERLAARLGASGGNDVDLDRVAEQVVSRLRSGEKVPAHHRVWPWLVAMAAAATLAVPGYQWLHEIGGGPSARVVAAPVLDLLTGAELAEVLDSLDFSAPVTEVVTATLDDMNEQQLEELLAIMEG